MNRPPRVVVADDQALVRTGFRLILDADGTEVVAEATDGAEAAGAVRRSRRLPPQGRHPGLLVAAVRMVRTGDALLAPPSPAAWSSGLPAGMRNRPPSTATSPPSHPAHWTSCDC